jgi:hypothetical protein
MPNTLLHVIPGESAACGEMERAQASAPLAPPGVTFHGASIRMALVALLMTCFASAQTLTGTVTNSTTGKPSGADEVVLFRLGPGMKESGRTKTGATGQFSFKLDDPQAPHLVRVIHQDVTYHRMVLPGTTSAALEVYDVARKVEGVKVFADIIRIRSAKVQMMVAREFAVQNASNPPRTQMNDRNLEFYLPDGAHVIDGSATATIGSGSPLKTAPVPVGENNRYSFNFPLRPGLTRFEVTYQVPYSGSANFDPKSIYPLEHFVVVLPKAIQFKAAPGSTRFNLVSFPSQPDATVHVASNTTAGQDLAFAISGEGTLEAGQQHGTQSSGDREHSSTGSGPGAQSNSRPGGGLGPPIDSPDPLQQYRWWILGGSAAVLIIGSVYVAPRQKSATRTTRRAAGICVGTGASVRAPSASDLLEGIKEELFQIEVEHKQGQISQSGYEKAKAALDKTLSRALRHEAQRT